MNRPTVIRGCEYVLRVRIRPEPYPKSEMRCGRPAVAGQYCLAHRAPPASPVPATKEKK